MAFFNRSLICFEPWTHQFRFSFWKNVTTLVIARYKSYDSCAYLDVHLCDLTTISLIKWFFPLLDPIMTILCKRFTYVILLFYHHSTVSFHKWNPKLQSEKRKMYLFLFTALHVWSWRNTRLLKLPLRLVLLCPLETGDLTNWSRSVMIEFQVFASMNFSFSDMPSHGVDWTTHVHNRNLFHYPFIVARRTHFSCLCLMHMHLICDALPSLLSPFFHSSDQMFDGLILWAHLGFFIWPFSLQMNSLLDYGFSIDLTLLSPAKLLFINKSVSYIATRKFSLF